MAAGFCKNRLQSCNTGLSSLWWLEHYCSGTLLPSLFAVICSSLSVSLLLGVAQKRWCLITYCQDIPQLSTSMCHRSCSLRSSNKKLLNVPRKTLEAIVYTYRSFGYPRVYEPFQRQRWGNVWETGRSAYGFSELTDTILNWAEYPNT